MIALESTFAPDSAADLRATYELRLGEERFSVAVGDGTITIARGSPRSPDAVIETDPGTLRALVFGDRKLASAPVAIRGDARLARTFFRLFARP
jgi:putative sterol carrier protein